jgi:hypothetical protein
MIDFSPLIRFALQDIVNFCEQASELKLRSYQEEVARAIIASVKNQAGETFVVMFPRQSGKNELQAQIETYLLLMLSMSDSELVKASPTWKPQSLNAMRRLERVFERNLITRGRWTKESGYIYRYEKARIYFLSGGEQANVVGATANVLLQCDEAQDVSIAKWDKDFAPMAASTNATKVFWGTAWTSRTLLARELKEAKKKQEEDRIKRVFVIDAADVWEEVPEYGDHVREQIRKLGRNHPMVRTQYFSEEIDAEGGMFPPERLQLMQGDHPELDKPIDGQLYAMTIDVAGEDEGAIGEDPGRYATGRSIDAESLSFLENPARDSTSVTIFNVDLSTLPADAKGAPSYNVVARYQWVGTKHHRIYNQLKELARMWRAEYIVIDSTGVGQGLASFMEKSFPGRVIPFLFTSKSKSDLGWKFLAVIETDRYKEPVGAKTEFWRQAKACLSQVLEGPGRLMRWGIPDGTRDEITAELIHDDELISAALCAVLDDQEWSSSGEPLVVVRSDPLMEMDAEGF